MLAVGQQIPALGFTRPRPHIVGMDTPTTLERAFALARSGDCATIDEIRRRLKAERFDLVEAHLSSTSLTRQLRALCDASRSDRPRRLAPTT